MIAKSLCCLQPLGYSDQWANQVSDGFFRLAFITPY